VRIGVRLKLTPVCDRWHRLTPGQQRAVFMAMLGHMVENERQGSGGTEARAAGEVAIFVGQMMDLAEREA